MKILLTYLVSSVILLLSGYVVFRVIVRRDYLQKKVLSTLSSILEVLIFALHANFIYLFLPVEWPALPSLPDGLPLNIISISLFCFGLVILILAWLGLGSGRSLGRGNAGLDTGGLYRYSRNPQLVGYGIMLFSLLVMFPSWYAVGWFLQYLLIAHFMLKTEEEFLNLHYGDRYKKYCTRVPRVFRLAK